MSAFGATKEGGGRPGCRRVRFQPGAPGRQFTGFVNSNMPWPGNGWSCSGDRAAGYPGGGHPQSGEPDLACERPYAIES